jgi:hypothetical protein
MQSTSVFSKYEKYKIQMESPFFSLAPCQKHGLTLNS